MINLIPNEEKKKKVMDFYFRLGVVFMEVLGFSILIASVSLLPSYFLSDVKMNFFNSKLEAEKNVPLPLDDQATLVAVNDLKNKLSMLESSEKNKYVVSQQVIGEIVLKKMSDIKINHIAYNTLPGPDKKITINGTAPSRERLLLFRTTLESDPLFKNVDLPISNFIKGSDISFSLTLTSAQ